MEKNELIEQGKKIGNEVMDALNAGATKMRDALVTAAKGFVSIETRNLSTDSAHWLAGYGEVCGNVRKSEASTVFQAIAKDEAKVLEFQGTYHAWITHCRNIKNDGASAGSIGAGTRSRFVSGKGFDKIKEQTKLLNADQVTQALAMLYTQLRLVSGDNWEKSFLVQIETLTNGLKQSIHPIYLNMSAEIIDVVGELLDKDRADEAKKQAGKQEQAPSPHNPEAGKPEDIEGEYSVIDGEEQTLPIAVGQN